HGSPGPAKRPNARRPSGDRTAADHRPRPVDRGLRVQGRRRAVPYVGPGRVPGLPDDDQRPADVRLEERRDRRAVPRLPDRPPERPSHRGATFGILAIVTQIVGNVVAIPQRAIKRMLPDVSNAQGGYHLIPPPGGGD